MSLVEGDRTENNLNSWIWLIIVILLMGIMYFRYRYLRSKDLSGKALAIHYIPGVPELVYAIQNALPNRHARDINAPTESAVNMMTEQDKKAVATEAARARNEAARQQQEMRAEMESKRTDSSSK